MYYYFLANLKSSKLCLFTLCALIKLNMTKLTLFSFLNIILCITIYFWYNLYILYNTGCLLSFTVHRTKCHKYKTINWYNLALINYIFLITFCMFYCRCGWCGRKNWKTPHRRVCRNGKICHYIVWSCTVGRKTLQVWA